MKIDVSTKTIPIPEDIINKATSSFQNHDYEKALELTILVKDKLEKLIEAHQTANEIILECSQQLEDIKEVIYTSDVEALLKEAKTQFVQNEYELAARNYERAAQWSSIESLEKTFIHEAFRLAINSWISACKIEDAFRILQSLPHKGVLIILR